jgi:hypothetical protein
VLFLSIPQSLILFYIYINRIAKQALTDGTAIVGGTTLLFIDPAVVELANECLCSLDTGGVSCNPARRVRVLYRVEISRQLYSSHYNRVKRRNSYTVMYTNNDGIDKFGLIQYYIFAADKIVLAIIERLDRLSVSCLDHFQLNSAALDSVSCLGCFPVRSSGSLDVVELSNIQEKCLHIELSSSSIFLAFLLVFMIESLCSKYYSRQLLRSQRAGKQMPDPSAPHGANRIILALSRMVHFCTQRAGFSVHNSTREPIIKFTSTLGYQITFCVILLELEL